MNRTSRINLPVLVGAVLTFASAMAHAVIDLDATGTQPVGTVTVSNETLTNESGRTVTVQASGQTYHVITLSATSTVLRVDGKIGVSGADNRQLFIRYDLENMVFRRPTSDTGAPPSTGTVRINDADNDGTTDTGGDIVTLSKEAGGGTGGDSVVYSAPDNAVIDDEAIVSAYLHNELAILPNQPGGISMSVYLSLTDALGGRQALASKSQTAVTTAPSLATIVTPAAPLTASVDSGFTQLWAQSSTVGANSPQPLGSLAVRVGPTSGLHVKASDGNTVLVPGDVVMTARSRTTFSGDFSIGSFALSEDGCATTTADSLRVNVAKSQAAALVPVFEGTRSLCITVPNTNETAIMPSAFLVEADYAPLANAAIGPQDLVETQIGRIRRDGTSVQIPHLTTAAEYEQRIVIVNRSSRAADYNFQFTPASGTTARDGAMAEGTVGASSTLVLEATDVVTLSGGTETAASLNLVAPFGRIDVLTTQINITNGATDTVRYTALTN